MTFSIFVKIIYIIALPLLVLGYYRLGLRVGKRRGKNEAYEEARKDGDFWKKTGEFWKGQADRYEERYDDAKRELEKERALRIEAERKVKLLECELDEAYDVGYEELEELSEEV